MSAFRKSVLTFAGIALLATSAFGQLPGHDGVAAEGGVGVTFPAANVPENDIVCNVTSQPLTVRVEGLSELLGDVELICSGNLRRNPRNKTVFTAVELAAYATAAPLVSQVNISVTLSLPVTNRFMADPLTDAILLVGDPANPAPGGTADNQNPCAGPGAVCTPLVAGDGVGTTATAGGITTYTPALASSGNSPGTSVWPTASVGTSAVNPLNAYQGVKQNNQTIVFVGVPINFYDSRGNPRLLARYREIVGPVGSTYDGREIIVPFTQRYRIKNLRGAIAGGASVNTQVFAFLSIQNPPARLQLNTASAVVGFVQTGLLFRQRNLADDGTNPTISLAQCVTQNRDLAVDATDANPFNQHFLAQFIEQYRVAFRIRGYTPGQPATADQFLPAFNYDTESGFYNSLFPATNNMNRIGIADNGTRLRLVVNNIPANVRVFVSVAGVFNTSATLGAYGVVADASGTNPAPVTVPLFPSASPVATTINGVIVTGAAIPVNSFLAVGSPQGVFLMNTTLNATGGTSRGVVTWEVYAASSFINEQINFLVLSSYRPANNPGLGTATIQGTFAPINTTATTGGFLVPVPRFVETGSATTGFSIVPCLTNLLFPFVTNQAGFNTGLAISNTSLSNPGTGELFSLDANAGIAPQQGTCTINYFGTTGADGAAPPPATTGVIPAGRTFTMTLASGSAGPFGTVAPAQNFQGYIIAQCNFRYAHGYAFISDIGSVQLAQGYVALILDGVLGTRTGILSESLGL